MFHNVVSLQPAIDLLAEFIGSSALASLEASAQSIKAFTRPILEFLWRLRSRQLNCFTDSEAEV